MDTRYCLHPVIVGPNDIFPCGKCPVCRMKYRKQMAMRIYMEKSIEKPKYSYFTTLTYDDDHIPIIDGRQCFDRGHITTFIDSLRHKLRKKGFTIRMFGTCEYGEQGYRPHYHFIFLLYGNGSLGRFEFNDRFCRDLWCKGFTKSGSVTLESIMYTTCYALKDDEFLERDWRGFEEGKPFRVFSLKPGLGLTDNCTNWWSYYVANGDEFRSSLRINLPKRSVSSGIPTGVKRRIKDTYPDLYEGLKNANEVYFVESIPALFENAEAFGPSRDYTSKNGVDSIDFSRDKEIKAFRKALRELSKRQRNNKL